MLFLKLFLVGGRGVCPRHHLAGTQDTIFKLDPFKDMWRGTDHVHDDQ